MAFNVWRHLGRLGVSATASSVGMKRGDAINEVTLLGLLGGEQSNPERAFAGAQLKFF
jgi:hypothetical protein